MTKETGMQIEWKIPDSTSVDWIITQEVVIIGIELNELPSVTGAAFLINFI